MSPRNIFLALASVLGVCAFAFPMGGCTWTPEARAIEARQIAAGEVFVLQHEPVAGEDFLTVVDGYSKLLQQQREAEAEAGNPPNDNPTFAELYQRVSSLPRSMLDVASGERCRIPGRSGGIVRRYDNIVAQLAPDAWRIAVVRKRQGEDSLEFVDQHCKSRGPRLSTGNLPASIYTDLEDLTPHAMVLTETGDLWHMNPWKDEKDRIARKVAWWSFAVASPRPQTSLSEERTLVLVQGGEIVLRTMAGKEIARFGENVQSVQQASVGGLRIAYQSGGSIYEAVAPELRPVRLAGQAQEACEPRYAGTQLTFLFPCEERQVTRIDLFTGEVETLDPGIASQSESRGWTFQTRLVKDSDPEYPKFETWVQPPNASKPQRLTPPLSGTRPLDSERLVGLDSNKSLGIWTATEGFSPVLRNVGGLLTYEDQRLTPDREEPVFLWVVHHDVKNDVGDLALLSAKDFKLEPIVGGVPVGGFVALQFDAVLDPALIIMRDLKGSGATLDARLIPELIGTTVDQDVIGFAPRADPQEPGLYYSVGPGEREGVWFAPL